MTTDKPSRNEDEYFVKQDAELLKRQRELAESAALEGERRSHYMKCPKDGYDLASSKYHGVQIETCPNCGGMWLDAGEIDLVAKEERPALFTRVLSDAFATLRARGEKKS
ncbi:MAG: zf-TFIIB domain-containing protein [Gemmatimonadales bacterium]